MPGAQESAVSVCVMGQQYKPNGLVQVKARRLVGGVLWIEWRSKTGADSMVSSSVDLRSGNILTRSRAC